MVVLQKDSALPVNSAIRAKDQVVGRVVRIGSSESLKDYEALVCLVVPVGVSKEEQVRSGCDQYPPIPKLETERVVNLREFDDSVNGLPSDKRFNPERASLGFMR